MRKLSILAILFLALDCAVPVCVAQSSNPQAAQSPQQANSPTKPNQANTDPPPELHKRNPRYRIEADDIMELSFRYTPEFDQEVTVQPDGFIQLKGLPGDVHVQGLTIPELIAELKKVYGAVLNDPVISVVLREFEKPYFIAGGQVGKPGKYDLRGDTTAGQAIAIAGGFADYAKNSQVLLFRRYSNDTVEVKIYDLKTVLKGKNVKEDPMLEPGDMLFVPKTWMANIDRFLPRSSLGTYFSPAFL